MRSSATGKRPSNFLSGAFASTPRSSSGFRPIRRTISSTPTRATGHSSSVSASRLRIDIAIYRWWNQGGVRLEYFSRRCIVWMAKLRAHAMARPYSDDLRRKLLEAFDQGKGSLSELAEDFGVSLGWAWKVSAARKRTGRMERPSYRPGAKRRIDEKALAGILRSQPDATLVELQAELESKTGLRVSTQHLWRVVKRLGFRLKKSHSTPKNVTRKRTASGAKSSSR
jgi:transposase